MDTFKSQGTPPGDLNVDQVVTAGVNLNPTLQRLSLFLWLISLERLKTKPWVDGEKVTESQEAEVRN